MTIVKFGELLANSAGSFEPIPKGDYNAIAVESKPAVSSGGKPMIKVKFRIESGPHEGRHVWNNFTLSPENPNALSFFFQHMAIFGMDSNFFTQLPDIDLERGADDVALQYIANTILNRRARLTIDQRSWNGQTQANVTAVNPAGPPGVGTPGVGAPTPSPSHTPTPTPAPQAQVAPPAPQPAPVAVPTAPPPPQAPAPAPAPQLPAPQMPVAAPQAQPVAPPAQPQFPTPPSPPTPPAQPVAPAQPPMPPAPPAQVAQPAPAPPPVPEGAPPLPPPGPVV